MGFSLLVFVSIETLSAHSKGIIGVVPLNIGVSGLGGLTGVKGR